MNNNNNNNNNVDATFVRVYILHQPVTTNSETPNTYKLETRFEIQMI